MSNPSVLCLLLSVLVAMACAAPLTDLNSNKVQDGAGNGNAMVNGQQVLQPIPSAADILSKIKFVCKEANKTHQVGDRWVNRMNFKMECLPSGMIQATGCHADGHDFAFSPVPTNIGSHRYYCCVNSKGAYSYQRVNFSANSLGPGQIVQAPDGQLQFIPQTPDVCN